MVLTVTKITEDITSPLAIGTNFYCYSTEGSRELTYGQIMAIGKLKQAMTGRVEKQFKFIGVEDIHSDLLKDYIQTGTIEGEKLNPFAESVTFNEEITSDCKGLNINLVITGEGSYVLDCINGVEYAVCTKDDYDKVVSAIRLLQEREI